MSILEQLNISPINSGVCWGFEQLSQIPGFQLINSIRPASKSLIASVTPVLAQGIKFDI